MCRRTLCSVMQSLGLLYPSLVHAISSTEAVNCQPTSACACTDTCRHTGAHASTSTGTDERTSPHKHMQATCSATLDAHFCARAHSGHVHTHTHPLSMRQQVCAHHGRSVVVGDGKHIPALYQEVIVDSCRADPCQHARTPNHEAQQGIHAGCEQCCPLTAGTGRRRGQGFGPAYFSYGATAMCPQPSSHKPSRSIQTYVDSGRRFLQTCLWAAYPDASRCWPAVWVCWPSLHCTPVSMCSFQAQSIK